MLQICKHWFRPPHYFNMVSEHKKELCRSGLLIIGCRQYPKPEVGIQLESKISESTDIIMFFASSLLRHI